MSRSPQPESPQEQVQIGDTDSDLPPLSAGDFLPAAAQRYELMEVLGSGAMGEVLVAQDSSLARKVAFKRMAPSVSRDPGLAARFLREMQVTAQLDHPNVVPVYADERSADGSTGYAMKLVRGRTLTKLIDEETRGSRKRNSQRELAALAARLEVFLRVCDAIGYAHAKGVLHRDLKPDNIMLGPYNEVYVMDWGICRVLGLEGAQDAVAANDAVEIEDDGSRTRVGAAIGTPAYMSPEQAMGKNDELDGRSDQFSLGLILYELVGLKRARQQGGVKATMVSAVAGAKLPLEHVNPTLPIPRELMAIVDKATAIDRAQRYESVDALAADVRRYLHGEAVAARKDTPLQRVLRFIGHHKQATLLALLIALTAGGGLTIFALLRGQAETARERLRNDRIGELTDKVDEQAHLIDNHFERSRGLVRALAARASALLSHFDGIHRPVHYSEEFDAGGGPPDTRMSVVHGRAISVDFPSFHLSPGVAPDQVHEELSALPALAQAFRDNLHAMLPDEGVNVSDDDFRALVADKGLPILRQFCSTASGVHEVYPGQGGFPPEYDGRLRPKYALAENQRGVLFGNPYVDHMAGGDLLPGAAAIYDEAGKFRGVCGLDLPFTDLRDRFLSLKGQRGFLEAFLVDKDAKILIRTKGTAEGEAGLHSNAALERESLPWPELAALLASGHSGTHELKGHHKLAAWSPISATGWRYLAIADLEKLFE